MGTSARQPLVLVETSNLPREEWLAYRRKGIGGSDAAAVLGISPFLTGRDLYYDKLGISAAADDENWIAKEIGNRLEPLVAKIFSERTGLKVFQRKFMFQHPQHLWMLADLDYLVEMPAGSTAILECKTSTSNAAGHWWYAGKEVVPAYYESQGRHYMAVMELNQVFFCCLLTDTHEVMIRSIDRDMAYPDGSRNKYLSGLGRVGSSTGKRICGRSVEYPAGAGLGTALWTGGIRGRRLHSIAPSN